MVNVWNDELFQNYILVSTFYKRPVQQCLQSTSDYKQTLLCERIFYLLVYAVRQVANDRSRKHCSSRTMATQSDKPTQPTPSANTENFYITEADQFVVNELLTFVSDKINTLPYDMVFIRTMTLLPPRTFCTRRCLMIVTPHGLSSERAKIRVSTTYKIFLFTSIEKLKRAEVSLHKH